MRRARAPRSAPPAGRSLPAAARGRLEAGFDKDLAGVRVHDGPAGADLARAHDASAVTVGSDIYFAPGEFAPEREEGGRLLAHEVAHTVQQRVGRGEPRALAPDASAALEAEADRAADAVLSGGRADVPARLAAPAPQRQPAGAETRRRIVDEYTRVDVERTTELQPCTRRVAAGEGGGSLFFDRDAAAFGIRFRYCRAGTEVTGETRATYRQLRDRAGQLVSRLPATALSGGDPAAEIETAAREAQVGASTEITLNVSGTLLARVSGQAQAGLQTQSYEVDGLLRLTPGRGWALELAGEYSHIADALAGTTARIEFRPRVDVGPVQVGVTVRHEERTPATGGAATPSTTYSGDVAIPFGQSGVGLTLSGSGPDGAFTISFGTVRRRAPIARPVAPSCYECECPPRRPVYRCRRVVLPHDVPTEVQPADSRRMRVRYHYNSDVPVDASEFGPIVDLVRGPYRVSSIEGTASPEANVAYNLALALRRARHARTELERRLAGTSAVLPAAAGRGELLGGLPGGGEAADRDLIRELGARLEGLGDDDRLRLFGHDPAALTPEAREAELRKIEEFRTGRAGGRALGTRARWERVFPELRRVDVELSREAVVEPRPVPGETGALGECDPETLAWAAREFPALPPERRVPIEEGNC